MKKILLVLGVFAIAGIIAFFIANEPLPEGQAGPDAEALAEKMMTAVNADAWEKIPFVSWTFKDIHHYVWDKRRHVVLVRWDDYEVIVDLNSVSGKALKDGMELTGEENEKAVEKAWAYWCNDSFWLNAPAKANDHGTTRKIVKDEDGNNQLMVQYDSGGATPGDAYLWKLDENFRPVSYKMWVSIIPLGGVEATWEDWVEKGGAMISTDHKLGFLDIGITNLKAGKGEEEFGLPAGYFDLGN